MLQKLLNLLIQTGQAVIIRVRDSGSHYDLDLDSEVSINMKKTDLNGKLPESGDLIRYDPNRKTKLKLVKKHECT
jgi:hypothetical protein